MKQEEEEEEEKIKAKSVGQARVSLRSSNCLLVLFLQLQLTRRGLTYAVSITESGSKSSSRPPTISSSSSITHTSFHPQRAPHHPTTTTSDRDGNGAAARGPHPLSLPFSSSDSYIMRPVQSIVAAAAAAAFAANPHAAAASYRAAADGKRGGFVALRNTHLFEVRAHLHKSPSTARSICFHGPQLAFLPDHHPNIRRIRLLGRLDL